MNLIKVESPDFEKNIMVWSDKEKSMTIRGGLIGYVRSKPLGTGQIISIDVLVDVMIIAVFHKKLI